MFSKMLSYEKKMWDKGIKLIAGIDEVGRGPLAGPLVVSAVVLDLEKVFNLAQSFPEDENIPKDHTNFLYTQIRDSKTVTDRNRRIINDFLVTEVISYSIMSIEHELIDKHGISQAVQEAFFGSVNKLEIKPDHVFTDHISINKLTVQHQTNIPRGDSVSISVAAASIIAKVYRDNIMIDMHEQYPKYGFHKHKGYGTKQHIKALQEHGPCEIHRKSFEPVKSMLLI